MSKPSSSHNALIHETSPYLLQHASNPVQWYPWGEAALRLAREQGKPILLSIGYSACHWCHVMAHESFEDPATAAVMNEHYINIKVDREERPDLDKIYQTAHHLITQRSGGWPLTMFLTPESHYPFYGGTYFPPQPRHGLPAFADLLEKIAGYYQQNSAQIEEHNVSLAAALAQLDSLEPQDRNEISPWPLNTAREELDRSFDSENGGFGKAPKFPQLPSVERLMRHYAMTANQGEADTDGLQMSLYCLLRMSVGGLYDQVGGGFYRYSVDEFWMIPHFEKMLYDNASFLVNLSNAWQVSQEPLFKRVLGETADWIIREMRDAEGGFYSSLDADSEGEEGKFYVWTREEVKSLLDADTYRVFAYSYGLDRSPNFEEQHWHLFSYNSVEQVARKQALSVEAVEQKLSEARAILFKARQARVAPGRDDKILTAWNALAIKGMAMAGLALGNETYIQVAEQALDFIREKLWVDGHLRATYKDGQARFDAYLDDYAFLLDAVLTLLQVRWREGDVQFAQALADVLLNEFYDKERGGFYFTGEQHERLITRPKSFADDAMPSGNGVAAQALGRLGHLLGETRYLEATANTLQAAWAAINQIAYAHNTLLLALEEYLFPPQSIILRGEGKALQTWKTICQQHYAPHRLCVAIPNSAQNLPGILANFAPKAGVVAYVCTGTQCSAPIENLTELQTTLKI
jgi:uncharacterized protein YyaL (SSP411 family)